MIKNYFTLLLSFKFGFSCPTQILPNYFLKHFVSYSWNFYFLTSSKRREKKISHVNINTKEKEREALQPRNGRNMFTSLYIYFFLSQNSSAAAAAYKKAKHKWKVFNFFYFYNFRLSTKFYLFFFEQKKILLFSTGILCLQKRNFKIDFPIFSLLRFSF